MKKVLENPNARNLVLASGYIKKDVGVQIELKAFEQLNKLISHATASAKKGRITDEKSAFINSALMVTTSMPSDDVFGKKSKMVDDMKYMTGILRYSLYRRSGSAKKTDRI